MDSLLVTRFCEANFRSVGNAIPDHEPRQDELGIVLWGRVEGCALARVRLADMSRVGCNGLSQFVRDEIV